MNQSVTEKKLVKRKGPIPKLAIPTGITAFFAVICLFIFWPFAILFAIISFTMLGIGLFGKKAATELQD